MSLLTSWQNAELPLPIPLDSAALAYVNNVLYLFGGFSYDPTNEWSYNQQIFKLNFASSSPSWTILSGITLSHLDCRHQCTAVIDNRYIYIYHPANSQFHVFDTTLEQFTHSAKNHFDEYGCIVSDPIHAAIYKIGQYLTIYNISADTWNPSIHDFPAPPSSIEHESCVYHPASHSFFAFPHDHPVLQYDITKQAWNTPNPHAVPTQSKENTDAVLAVDGMIYIMGGTMYGTDPKIYLSNVDVYDPTAYTLVPTMPLNIVSGVAAAVTFGGKIYVFGGVNNRSEVSNSFLASFETTDGVLATSLDITEKKDAMDANSQTNFVIAAIGGAVLCLLLLLYFVRFRKSEDPVTFRHIGEEHRMEVKSVKTKVREESDGEDERCEW